MRHAVASERRGHPRPRGGGRVLRRQVPRHRDTGNGGRGRPFLVDPYTAPAVALMREYLAFWSSPLLFRYSLYHIKKRGGLFPWQSIIPRVLTSITFRTLERPFPYDAELIGEYKVLVIGKIVS